MREEEAQGRENREGSNHSPSAALSCGVADFPLRKKKKNDIITRRKRMVCKKVK